jgi:hypothetical protein
MRADTPEPASGDVRRPAKEEGWFATFTFLDVTGSLHSSHVRRLGAAVIEAWKWTLRAVSDQSKSRVVGV